MTGHERESQLSAMFDGELPQEECELLARRLSRDENLRRSYAHYALIGSVIRNEPMASQAFAAKVHGALRGAPLSAVESASVRAAGDFATATSDAARAAGAGRNWVWPLGAVGVAASVAVIALLSLDPSVIQGTPTASGSLASNGTAGPATAMVEQAIIEEVVTASAPSALVAEVVIPSRPISLEPESYVTPPAEGLSDRRLAPAVQLANYVVAHGTVSVPMMRHSALSAFITDLEIAAGAEMAAGSAAAGSAATGSAAATGSEASPR